DLNADGSRGAGDGKIDQAKEVVLSLWGDAGMTDMEALAKARDASGTLIFDSNGDGKLTAADTAWNEFRVWQDADQDGVTDAGELKTLDEMGFTQIGLTYDDGDSGEGVDYQRESEIIFTNESARVVRNRKNPEPKVAVLSRNLTIMVNNSMGALLQ
ncbi:MAG: hypothetical protein IOC96_05040, partial [Rhodobacter sp.]|nr:hypothetical protein [Rhodobacter sp.]